MNAISQTAAVGVLTRNGDVFEWRGPFETKDIAKAAGLRWNPTSKLWTTRDPVAASLLHKYADLETRAFLDQHASSRAATIEASRAASADVDVPVPQGLSYLPYQRAGIAFASANPNVLIADEMGLGKTIQAIGAINADATLRKILVICPASLRLNWRREMTKWLVEPRKIGIAETTVVPGTEIVIGHYDIFARTCKAREALRAIEWDLLVLDEAHYCKTPKAKRTQHILGSKARKLEERVEPIKARRKIFLTGTPETNRPVELWPIANALDPVTFPDFFGFAKRYCAGHNNGYGWDFSGASNLEELQERLRGSIMIRRKKADVLTELPPKRRQVIEIPANGASDVVANEGETRRVWDERLHQMRLAVELAKVSDNDADYATAVEALRQGEMAAFAEMSKRRHETALAKIPYVIDHLIDMLDEQGLKVVAWAHHKDALDKIYDHFRDRAVIAHGDYSTEHRDAAVQRFQTDDTCRLMVAGIQAMGVGHTMTASSTVVFAELDWVPGNLTQAEDRCHRIGQRESVLVQHLVLEGSLDAHMANVLVEKQEVLDKSLDRSPTGEDRARAEAHVANAEATAQAHQELVLNAPVIPQRERDEPASKEVKRSKFFEEGEQMTPEQIAAVHETLRRLAGMCDHAARLDGSGFNRLDAGIGHDLAGRSHLSPAQAALGRKVVRKYRKQYSPALLEAMGVTA